MVKTIFGVYITNPCAYCHYHEGYLTVRQMKNKDCLGKQCNRLQKSEHPYWTYREHVKDLRRKRKEKTNV